MPEPKSLTDNIPHEYILMPNIKKAFDPEGVGQKWSLEECEFKMSSKQYIAICYYLKDTNYAVVDIDTDDYNLDQLYEDTGIDSMSVKGNSKGYHVWVEFTNGKPDECRKNERKCSNLCEIDFLGEKVWERLDKEWNGEFPCQIHPASFKKCFLVERFAPKKKTDKPTQQATGNIDLLKKMLDLIDDEYCYDRDDWFKIITAMKKCGFTEEEGLEWSSNTIRYSKKHNLKENFNEDRFSTDWDSYDKDEIQTGEHTIRHYAKLSNPTEYKKMTHKENYFLPLDVACKGALNIAECIAPKLEQNLKWSNETWYMFYKKTNLWMKTKQPSHIIIQVIHKHIDFSIKLKIEERSKLDAEDDEGQKRLNEQIKQYTKLYDQVDKSGFYSMISKHLETILYDSEFYRKLDTNLYEVAFKNGIYDLRTKTFRYGYTVDDYLTNTIDFDYTEPTQEDMDFIKDQVLFKICNANKSHLEYYLNVLGQSLTGDAEMEKALYFMVGVGGNNGKTLIFEALQEIMPNYVGEIDRKTFENGYSKAHKHLQNLRGKRIVYVEEMSGKEQNIEVLKQIGDGKVIKNEIMYGTDETINVMCKLFFLSNCQANLKIDGGIGNRYKQICHNSSFQPQNITDDYTNLQFIQNRNLAGLLKGKYKHALIQLLMDCAHNYTKSNVIDIPEEFQEAIKNTLDSNDEVKCFIDDYCEYGEDFKCSKQDLEEHLNKPFREIQVEVQRITNIKYNRQMKDCGKVGGFKGFRIKPVCNIDLGSQL